MLIHHHVVTLVVAVSSVVSISVVHVLHVWPRVDIVGIATTDVDLSCHWIDTINEWNPKHFQLGRQVECLSSDDSVEIAVFPLDTEHGGRALDVGLLGGGLSSIVVVVLRPSLHLWPLSSSHCRWPRWRLWHNRSRPWDLLRHSWPLPRRLSWNSRSWLRLERLGLLVGGRINDWLLVGAVVGWTR